MISRIRTLFSGGDLTARLSRTTLFSLAGFATENLVRLAGNLVLTRLLFPEAFGLMAIVTVVMSGLAMISDIGIRPSIIQSARGKDLVFLNTAWTIQVIRSLILFAIAWAIAAPVAAFYEEPLLAEMLPVAGLLPLMMGFASTRMSTANRDLQLGRLTLLSIGAQIAGLILTIILAYWFRSVWALLWGMLLTPLLLATLSHVVLPGNRDRLQFEWAAARELFSFGIYIFIATVAGFLVQHGDRVVLGKFVSLEDLALYNIALFLAMVPRLLSSKLIDVVFLPLYVQKPPAESADNRRKVIKVRFVITGFLLAMAFVFGALGDWLIVLLYDVRYEAAGPIMVLIAIAQMPVLITASYDRLAIAVGETRNFAIIVICLAVIRVSVLLVATMHFGVVGAAFAALPSTLLHYPILIAMTRKYKCWSPLHDVLYLLLAAALAAIVIWLNAEALAPLFVGLGAR